MDSLYELIIHSGLLIVIGALLVMVLIFTGINTTILTKIFTAMKESNKRKNRIEKEESATTKTNQSENAIQYEPSNTNELPIGDSIDAEKNEKSDENADSNSNESAHKVPDWKSQDHKSVKEKVENAIQRSNITVQVEDLPEITQEMSAFFKEYKADKYYELLDIVNRPDTRIVVVGDTHSDLTSLVHLLKKLLIASDYDYFEKAYFVFLGDYLDRGDILFEYLRLLFDLKRILGDRCIFLKGNHELVYFSDGQLKSRVRPSDTVETLNEYCRKFPEFMEAFADYFSSLTNYVLVKTRNKSILLVHGSIPKDVYVDRFALDHETGAMLFSAEKITINKQDKPVVESESIFSDVIKNQEKDKVNDSEKNNNENETKVKGENIEDYSKDNKVEQEQLRREILYTMLWGDPVEVERRMQGGEARFEFGRLQFENFADKNKIDLLIRAHVPVSYGSESFFNGRLFTVFSSGGADNKDTYYQNVVDPAFGVIENDGNVIFENVFSTLAITKDQETQRTKIIPYNSLNNEVIPSESLHKFTLNKEFIVNH